MAFAGRSRTDHVTELHRLPPVIFPVGRVRWDEGTGSLWLRDKTQILFSRTEMAAETVIPLKFFPKI